MNSKAIATILFVLTSSLLAGCQPTPTTGGDSPLTPSRLRGSTATYIGNRDLTWSFADTTVQFTHQDKVIPGEFASEIVGEESPPKIISASWELTDGNRKLHLFNITIDEEPSDLEASLPIAPAGHVRINLGSYQYNLGR